MVGFEYMKRQGYAPMPERPEDAERPPTTRLTCGVTAKDEDMEDNAAKPASLLKRLTDPNFISRLMQLFLSGVLFVLGGILSVLLLVSTWNLIMLVFVSHEMSGSEILGSIVIWFLYFEFLALITKYYQSGLHFPLRYFIYIGITAIIRLIILYHDDPVHTLIFSISILVLVVALYLANTKLLKRE